MRYHATLAVTLLTAGCVHSSVSPGDVSDGLCLDMGSDANFSPDMWSYCRPIAPGLFMYYTPPDDDGNALLGLRAPGHKDGWSALALAGNGGMKGASQIVVRKKVEDGGAWVAEDRFSDAYATPRLDEKQDVGLLFASQDEDDGTSWGVVLRADSCDEHDYPVVDRAVWMHWALGSDHSFGYHGEERGQFHANLMRPPPSGSGDASVEPRSASDGGEDPVDVVYIRMPEVDVVTGEGAEDPTNPYICSFFDMDELKREHDIETAHNTSGKVHVTHIEALIDDPATEKYVHHIILYACDAESESDATYAHEKVIPGCDSMPDGCEEMKFAWARGGKSLTLPPDVGVPLGGEEGSKWLVLQMHYYNPDLDEGIVDSSGISLHFTSQLREHDAGFMQLVSGVAPFQRDPLPANQSSVSIEPFVVPPSCTDWDEPINVLGVAHHMHQVGKEMTIEVVRDGVNLGPMRLERRWDFNFHSTEESAIPRLLPGDAIQMTCEYDTSSRTEDVKFGEGSQDEMCYAVVLYYPRKIGKETFAYFPPRNETTAKYEMLCSSPGNGTFSNVSMCTELYVTSIPTLMQFDIGFDFGAEFMCNSGQYESMVEPNFPETCPPCYKDKSCTSETILAWGQEDVCPKRCNEYGGLSLFPDTSKTTPSITHGAWCGEGAFARYFEYDLVESQSCSVRGDLNVQPMAASTENSSGNDESSGAKDEISGANDETRGANDETRGANDETRGANDESSSANDESSSGFLSCRPLTLSAIFAIGTSLMVQMA